MFNSPQGHTAAELSSESHYGWLMDGHSNHVGCKVAVAVSGSQLILLGTVEHLWAGLLRSEAGHRDCLRYSTGHLHCPALGPTHCDSALESHGSLNSLCSQPNDQRLTCSGGRELSLVSWGCHWRDSRDLRKDCWWRGRCYISTTSKPQTGFPCAHPFKMPFWDSGPCM